MSGCGWPGQGYCPEHDPILACGHCRCGECGRAAWPTDAEWLDDGTILASYPAACPHAEPGTVFVVDPGQLGPNAHWCNATAASTGTLCRNRAVPGSEVCRKHGRKRVP